MRPWVAWVWYAAASVALLLLLAVVVSALVAPANRDAVWIAAAVALVVQLLAFLALVLLRGEGQGFLIGWGGGMLLRFAVVAVAALLLRQTEALDPATTLVSLVGFVFVLVLVEPIFLRLAD